MTDDERVLELLRAANPVPHHRDAIRVVRETDPLWHTVQARLADEPRGEVRDEIAARRRSEEVPPMNTVQAPTRRRPWIPLAAAAAAIAVIAVAVATLRPDRSTITYVGGDRADLPTWVVAPEDVAASLDVTFDRVNLEMGAGLAPRDCAPLGPVTTEEEVSYGALSEERLMAAVTGARMADAASASALLDRIREDIADCDRSEHGLFAADLESISDVDAGDRAFVMSVLDDDGRRQCYVWAQQSDRIGYVSTYRLDPAPSTDQCNELAQVAADALPRR